MIDGDRANSYRYGQQPYRSLEVWVPFLTGSALCVCNRHYPRSFVRICTLLMETPVILEFVRERVRLLALRRSFNDMRHSQRTSPKQTLFAFPVESTRGLLPGA